MIVEIGNTVVILHDTVGIGFIFRTQTILDNKQRLLIAIPQHIQQSTQADRVNLPAPL
ncbi:hypothetical protein D3C71_2108980 [compost metagenome]